MTLLDTAELLYNIRSQGVLLPVEIVRYIRSYLCRNDYARKSVILDTEYVLRVRHRYLNYTGEKVFY